MSAKLPLLREDTYIGEATVLKVFELSGKRKATVAGCRVKQGQLRRKESYRIYRNSKVVFEGRRHKCYIIWMNLSVIEPLSDCTSG